MTTTAVQLDPGERAARFINRLTHTKGEFARKPFDLRPWQDSIIRRIFGTIGADGLRQYNTVFIFLPRKNGKSEIVAAIALYCLIAEPEFGGEIYGAAGSREQAGAIFNVAAQMIRQDPYLSRVCKIVDSTKRIIYPPTNSVYKVVSSESKIQFGWNASVVIHDELLSAPNDQLWKVLTTSMGTRRQPLAIGISTAAHSTNTFAYSMYEYACRVRDGQVDDPSFLPIIFEAKPDDDWTSEATWHKANPALGDFRSLREMRQEFRKALALPTEEIAFKQLYLNLWPGRSTGWLPMPLWDKCARPIDVPKLEGQTCWAGLDLGAVNDFSALVLIFRTEKGFDILPYFWIPRAQVEERRIHGDLSYVAYEKAGLIEVTEGNVTDFNVVRARINELAKRFRIKHLGIDRLFDSYQFTNDLMSDGIDVVPCGQGWRTQSLPMKEIERMVLEGTLNHGGHKVLRWMADNAIAIRDSNQNLHLDKESAKDKVDGIAALINAVYCWMNDCSATARPYYEHNPLIVLT